VLGIEDMDLETKVMRTPKAYSMHGLLTRGVVVVVVVVVVVRRGFKTWWQTTIVVLGGYQLL
jgi:hypothetical protein